MKGDVFRIPVGGVGMRGTCGRRKGRIGYVVRWWGLRSKRGLAPIPTGPRRRVMMSEGVRHPSAISAGGGTL